MERLNRLRRLIRYDDWANRETLASLRAAREAPAKALKVFAHVLGAERLWLDRLKSGRPSVAVWPEFSLDRCQAESTELERRWQDYLDDLSPEEFEREIAYVNSKGERWSSTVSDVLNHVLLHSAYHRGQIAAELRAAGAEPASTDFIHAARTGVLS
jgi:uncharacterized damage-inducible protein DinB